MNYLAMIFDIKDSKLLKNRKEVQYKVISTIKEANILFTDIIACSFAISAGDEWQGLLKDSCDYNIVYEHFKNKLGDIRFYCGIGRGEVTIDDFRLTANQLDGPSFYAARNAVNLAKKLNLPILYLNYKMNSK